MEGMFMKDLISYIAKALVDYPDDVSVRVVEDAEKIEYVLKVHPSDRGKIIGKHGKVVKSIRTIIVSLSEHHKKRIALEIERDSYL
jgi:predicted RNA-binding protein YlqC (UPF0109 family)